jgi:hypothetical protein
MKIALCLAGQPRFLDKAYPNIKINLMDGYDVDVFVHAWVDETNQYDFKNDGTGQWNNQRQDPKSKQNILDLYKPKSVTFESPKVFEPTKINGVPSYEFFKQMFSDHAQQCLSPAGFKYYINAIHSQWYSIMMSNTLRELYRMETGTEYDYVVRARFDIVYNQKIIYEQLDPAIMYVASCVHPEHIHDFFAISGLKNMNIYSSAFLNLEYFLGLCDPGWRNSEGALFQRMKHFGIPCQQFGEIIHVLRPGDGV